MIDHFNLPVSNIEESRSFYDSVLSVLGFGVVAEDDGAVGYGICSWDFGIEPASSAIHPLHVAFKAKTRADVDAFYKMALECGATDNGAPGERPHYGEQYYACYLIDADGHNVEAVHRGEGGV